MRFAIIASFLNKLYKNCGNHARMPDYGQKIRELEEELKKTKYNKATQGHIGLVKAKLAILKEKEVSRSARGTGKSAHGYSVRKSGDATVLLLGFPSTGKSTLLNKLAGTSSEVAAYAFTTLSVIPGMLEYKQSRIQILDVPGIVSGAASGRGRGREVLAVIRNADLVLIIIDATQPEQCHAVLREVWESGIRINKVKPEVFIKKTARGGIHIGKTVPLEVDDETLKRVLQEFKVNNAEVLIRSAVDVDGFIDCIEGNKKYLPAVVCVNKVDLVSVGDAERIKKELNADILISAEQSLNLEYLKDLIYRKLDFMRIYLKEPRKDADMDAPLIIAAGATIKDVCDKLHRDFAHKFRFARVWGRSARHPAQKVMLHHRLEDRDILEIHVG